jgi:hypothetical protein
VIYSEHCDERKQKGRIIVAKMVWPVSCYTEAVCGVMRTLNRSQLLLM